MAPESLPKFSVFFPSFLTMGYVSQLNLATPGTFCGLQVMSSSPNSPVGGGVSGVSHEGGVFMNGTGVLIKEPPQSSLIPSSM